MLLFLVVMDTFFLHFCFFRLIPFQSLLVLTERVFVKTHNYLSTLGPFNYNPPFYELLIASIYSLITFLINRSALCYQSVMEWASHRSESFYTKSSNSCTMPSVRIRFSSELEPAVVLESKVEPS